MQQRNFGFIVFFLFLLGGSIGRAGTWTNFGSGMNAGVHALTFDHLGNLYAGGEFTSAGGGAVNCIAKWNGTTWTDLAGTRAGGNVYELACDRVGNLYAAGGNEICKWNGTVWSNISSGINWYVYALACDHLGNLYAGGSFTTIGGVTVNHIAKWNGVAWTNLGSGMDYYVEALACDHLGNLYAGGSFTNAGGLPAKRVAKWNGAKWSSLGSGIDGTVNSVVRTLVLDGAGNLYAGGDFSVAGGLDAFAVAKWNGISWSGLGGGMNFSVEALAWDGAGNLYAGGNFSVAGGLPAKRVAKWNGAAWSNLGSGLNNSAVALACDASGALCVGGYFSAAGGLPAGHIAKWIPGPVGPIIKANGSANDIVITRGTELSITVQLDPGPYQADVDWWVIALAGSAWFYMDSSGQWTQNYTGNIADFHSLYAGALFNLPVTEVLKIRPGAGHYTFWFAVDYPMDGVLKPEGAILLDAVQVTVH